MGLIYLFIKVFPFFGIALIFLTIDLARNFKRKGNPTWIGMIAFSVIFMIATILWIVFRGDKNADYWFKAIHDWFQGK